jgi:hypothetical protein
MYFQIFDKCPEGLEERIRIHRLAVQMSRQLREDARLLSKSGGDAYRVSLLYAKALSIEDFCNCLFIPYPNPSGSTCPFSDN